MPYVSVKFKVLIPESYDKVIAEYNRNKPNNWQPLEKLDRVEGGFQINIPDISIMNDANDRIKQVRWHKMSLRTRNRDIPFSDEETILLYKSMETIFGKDKIEFVNHSSMYFG
jgi:hypothetical protein